MVQKLLAISIFRFNVNSTLQEKRFFWTCGVSCAALGAEAVVIVACTEVHFVKWSKAVKMRSVHI